MALLTAGITPQPYGLGGRKVTLPVKALAQIYEGCLVSQVAGACVVTSTASAGAAIGVAEHDQLGGASDGTKRISVLTDQIFLFVNGTAAFTDATPYNTLAFAEDDHTVGTGGLGATQQTVGLFRGLEDDGRVRVYIESGLVGAAGVGILSGQVFGTNIPNAAATTVQRVGRISRYLVPVIGQNTTVTLGTTGAVYGDVVRVIRTDASAFTLAVANGGVGAGTLCTLLASKVGDAQAFFDGTNWLFDGAAPT